MNISRKKDIEFIKKLLDWNEYHPNKIDVTWNKNKKHYEVQIVPKDPEWPVGVSYFPSDVLTQLQEKFVFTKIYYDRVFKPGAWSSSGHDEENSMDRTKFTFVRRDEVGAKL